jgi:hypothetical protein
VVGQSPTKKKPPGTGGWRGFGRGPQARGPIHFP